MLLNCALKNCSSGKFFSVTTVPQILKLFVVNKNNSDASYMYNIMIHNS